MTLISARDSAHGLIVMFMVQVQAVCSCSSFLDWRNGFTKFLLTMLMEKQTVTNPAIVCGLCASTGGCFNFQVLLVVMHTWPTYWGKPEQA